MSQALVAPSYGFTVPPSWCDYNRHFSDGYYLVAFSTAADLALEAAGLGPSYRAKGDFSAYTVEAQVRYLREAKAGDALLVEQAVLDYDPKRLLLLQHMKRDSSLLATCECLYLHVDTRLPKAAPFPAEVLGRIARLQACGPAAGEAPGARIRARR